MLKFGTSGLRGLVAELTDKECYLFTAAFLKYLAGKKLIKKNSVAIAGDLRPSTKRILKACIRAIEDFRLQADFCGIIPTQTVSLYGFKRNIPSIMATGSHVPYDRNGIKFNLPNAEILKKDEKAITKCYQKISAIKDFNHLFDKNCLLKKSVKLPEINLTAQREYIERYIKFFNPNLLKGKKIVVYQHSAVIRDLMVEILKKLGAIVIPVNRSEKFIPIDTEAISANNLKNAKKWIKKYSPDAIVSADGDSDRPMLFDETGNFIRGDFLGLICSSYLKADSVSTTASCSTALEKSNRFKKINRTKIGSPYVVEAMQKDEKKGYKKIVSYEANGGYLTQGDIFLNGRKLKALPTRDSMLPLLSALALSIENKLPLSKLLRLFPQRFVFSNSLKGFPTETSKKIIERISRKDSHDKKTAQKLFDLPVKIIRFDFLDGARIFLANEEIIHIRPSGNSPELRVYCEADTFEKAQKLAKHTLASLKNKFLS